MERGTIESSRHVQSVLAALDVLDCFQRSPELNIMKIMDITGLTRNRVVRLTGTLVERGFLLLNANTGIYSLGSKIMILGRVLEQNFDLVSLTRPLLKRLAIKTGESASLYVIDGADRLVLAREEGTHEIRYSVAEGQRLAIHAGAGGKVLLAYGPEETRMKILGLKKLTRLTTQTIVNKKKLISELKKIRSHGYAYSRAERAPDAASIAAPVFDHENRLKGSIGIAGPVSRVDVTRKPDYLNAVLITAKELSRLLGWKETVDE